MLQSFTWLRLLHPNLGKPCDFGEIPWPCFGSFKNKRVTANLAAPSEMEVLGASEHLFYKMVSRALSPQDSLVIQ